MVFKTAPKVTKHLGYFYNKICSQDIPKIAHSGHTGSEHAANRATADECKMLRKYSAKLDVGGTD